MAIMNEGERLRELLDGSMDPSELENYNEFYRLAERPLLKKSKKKRNKMEAANSRMM
uniref:Uncharacterized protein n=1 Tax=uncultured Poseidoniia archaeon TaxID=1697135 RepID=A0A1B1TCX1_9ARCH|nr:hypothetical protein [uncultured Candidatus Thalassoarchaea sp.]